MAKKERVYMRTSVGGYSFDAIVRADHTSELEMTSHPVQSGSALVDHSYLKPKKLTLQVGVSDSALNGASYGGGSSRSVNAFKLMLTMQANRQPVTVVTKLHTYKNMLIQSISAPDDFKTQNALDATITFQEVPVATISIVKVSARPQVTGSTNRGTPQPVEAKQSVLKQLGSLASAFLGR
ncbi:phage baseplate protein [Anaerotruncus rubiinfantis]|uniref:phage baseplate protein n=1 Tax=Anaerotruncus rubiinfantis TaxID=1720200 RepID=UPI0034A4DECA